MSFLKASCYFRYPAAVAKLIQVVFVLSNWHCPYAFERDTEKQQPGPKLAGKRFAKINSLSRET
jgi:hypothetical protein